ncbi:CBS domain-containing protein [Acetobacter oeni]|uniref:Signal transduction protein n=1 Tax=Acetobacter oeni TaxID=304077 RepID=A0A511XH89_9PROT|nr:CBS domain-containing protein [Acetobacter oeni]MBB3882455.1 CBS domain-containing protein [Acetobacter oeni]NHO18451.1 CBS domain-containing protein [Acetobacter oeni]GBR06222.1 putative cystathionine-beta-synthase O [Acetobacter oeni LMG 21952]GEN62310.1 signal transduction protein [Acetobacter oeni]
MSSRVFHILARKGHSVITVGENDTVLSIASTLMQHNIGGAPVVDSAGNLVGLVSEKTIVSTVANQKKDFSTLLAKNIMQTNMPTAIPDDSIYDIACRMTYYRTRHVPVLEDGKLAGLVSIGDIVKLRAENAEQEAQELQDYVTGSDHASVRHAKSAECDS